MKCSPRLAREVDAASLGVVSVSDERRHYVGIERQFNKP